MNYVSKNNKIIIGLASLIILVTIFFGIKTTINKSDSATRTLSAQNNKGTNDLPGLQTTKASWIAEISHLKERLTAIHSPALAEEGTALHKHQHLDIFIHGKPLQIPALIGINEAAGFISPIHVHDLTGIIHVESPTIQKFTLGQFFDIWGVRFNQSSIGGYSTDASSTLYAYVNGERFSGDPRDIELTSHEEILIIFGTPSEQPTIPTTYLFPAGL